MLYNTTVEKIKNFRYHNECGFFLNVNGVERYFIYTYENPYIKSLLRLINQRIIWEYKYFMVTNSGVSSSLTLIGFKNKLKTLNIDEKSIDLIVDLYMIHSKNRTSKYVKKPQEIIQNQQKKSSIFRVFCRKWFGL